MSLPHNLLLLTLALDSRRVELETENARLTRLLYRMMDRRALEVALSEAGLDRLIADL